jgi:hypothetical protein
MSTPSNLGLRRLVKYDRRNSPLPSLSNAPTVGDTASEAPADKPLAVQAVSSTGNRTCVENHVVYCATGTEIYISAG